MGHGAPKISMLGYNTLVLSNDMKDFETRQL